MIIVYILAVYIVSFLLSLVFTKLQSSNYDKEMCLKCAFVPLLNTFMAAMLVFGLIAVPLVALINLIAKIIHWEVIWDKLKKAVGIKYGF